MHMTEGVTMIIRSACRVSMSEGEEPDYRQIIPDANLRRRIGRIVRMGLAAASGCVGRADGVKPDAVIASTALGCLADTEKFMKEMIEREESMLNPSAFIYSTFNTIAGQIALAGGIREYNMTYADGGRSFRSALLDAYLCLSEGKKNILVVAFDENTPSSDKVFHRLGKQYIHAPEAVAFLLSSEGNGPSVPEETFLCPDCDSSRDMAGNIVPAVELYRYYQDTLSD